MSVGEVAAPIRLQVDVYFTSSEQSASRTVILLHGLFGSGRVWNAVRSLLVPGLRLLCPHLVGFGDSPKPKGPKFKYDVPTHARLVYESLSSHLLETEGVDVVAHSFGTLVGAELAILLTNQDNPVRVRSITLLAPIVFHSAAEAASALTAHDKLASAMLHHPALGKTVCFLFCQQRWLWNPLLPHMSCFRRYPREAAEDYLKHSIYSAQSTIRDGLFVYSIEAALQTVMQQVPDVFITAVHGTRDVLVPSTCTQHLTERFPTVTGWFLQHKGHNFPLLAPLDTADCLNRIFHEFDAVLSSSS